MYVIVDDRDLVTTGYRTGFDREGVAAMGFKPGDFHAWISAADDPDVSAIEAILLGDCAERERYPRLAKSRCQAPVIAMNDTNSLEQTLGLFAAGVDDVVRKPIHVKEIMARVGAFNRRTLERAEMCEIDEMRIYFDG